MRFTILIVSVVFTVLGADGGEISKRSYSRHFEWEPSDCYKPHPPAIYELDEFTQYQIEAYLSEVESYRTCIRTEGESDFSDANRKLAQAIEQGIDETLSEVDDDLRHLETSILLVE